MLLHKSTYQCTRSRETLLLVKVTQVVHLPSILLSFLAPCSSLRQIHWPKSEGQIAHPELVSRDQFSSVRMQKAKPCAHFMMNNVKCTLYLIKTN